MMNLSFEPIAADAGATELLGEPGSLKAGRIPLAFQIPKEVKDALYNNFPPPKRVRFSVGQETFVGRTFLVQPVASTAQPLIALYVQRDSSVSNAIDWIASQYNLTSRERETLRGITIGLTSKQMAEQMNISPNTVKLFLRIIMLKMGTTTRTGIVSKVLEGSNNNSRD